MGFLGGGLGGCGGDEAQSAVSGSSPVPVAKASALPTAKTQSLSGFNAVAANSLDTITVPVGYESAVFCRWGDPLFPNSPAWKGDASEDAEAQRLQFGDNQDGMHSFALSDDGSEGLLVMNHEYINPDYFFTPDILSEVAPWSAASVLKGQHAHGASVAHVKLKA